MKNLKKLLAIFLAIVLAFSAIGLVSVAQSPDGDVVYSMNFASISDIHYYPDTLYSDEDAAADLGLYDAAGNVLETAVETLAANAVESGLKYVLVPGDLTADAEYESHVALATALEKYEEMYDIDFLVINGNHDINTSDASSTASGEAEQVDTITADEFKEVYANLGYDLAIAEYTDTHGEESGYLSYVAELEDGYRLIAVDSCKYSFDEAIPQITGGAISDETMAWIEEQAALAIAEGDTPILMMHHRASEFLDIAASVLQNFVIDDYEYVAESFASFGINFIFTGHVHTNDIGIMVNDDGEVLYDCETSSIADFPNQYREMSISTYESGLVSMDYSIVDFDAVATYTKDGVTYDNSTYKYSSFQSQFGKVMDDGSIDMNVSYMLTDVVTEIVDEFIVDVEEYGSILEVISGEYGLDLEALLADFLEPYLGDGISILGYTLFSTENIIWFAEDLLDQIYDVYLEDPTYLYDFIFTIIDDLMSIEISEYQSTQLSYLEIGVDNEKGTIGDLLLSLMAYWYMGNEDASEDLFIQDVIEGFKDCSIVEMLIPYLLDVVVVDVLEDELLSSIEINVSALLSDDFLMKQLGDGLDYLVDKLLRGDNTYMNLVDIVLALEILDYTSITDALNKLFLDEYLTDSVYESVSLYLEYVATDFITDTNPLQNGDYDVSYTNANQEVEVSQENYRLPTMVAVTLGDDSETSANIKWFSKSTVGGDIEIYEDDGTGEPVFVGEATVTDDFSIELSSQTVERSFPGLDLGFIGFFDYYFDMNEHTAVITDLEPDTTYYYRVGDAEKGWWSETGTITTADGSDSVTFIHTTDPQAQNEIQYNASWSILLDLAYEMYPDTDFMLNSGDIVDDGSNTNQWQAAFDTASTQLMSTFFMPASGNHEEYGDYSLANQFVLPNMPEDQDLTTGAYYSFEYNNVYIAVLNTNDLDDNEQMTQEQIDWLTEDIAQTDATWKFVSYHKAIYSSGSHYDDSEIIALREQISELMTDLDIDMVFQGHDHIYFRTQSLVSNEVEACDMVYLEYNDQIYTTLVEPTGSTYVITGASGVKYYDVSDSYVEGEEFPAPACTYTLETPMYASIEIVDEILYFNAYALDTADDNAIELVDSFAIAKDVSQGNYIGEYVAPETEEEAEIESAFTLAIKEILATILEVFKVIINIIEIYVFNVEL